MNENKNFSLPDNKQRIFFVSDKEYFKVQLLDVDFYKNVDRDALALYKESKFYLYDIFEGEDDKLLFLNKLKVQATPFIMNVKDFPLVKEVIPIYGTDQNDPIKQDLFYRKFIEELVIYNNNTEQLITIIGQALLIEKPEIDYSKESLLELENHLNLFMFSEPLFQRLIAPLTIYLAKVIEKYSDYTMALEVEENSASKIINVVLLNEEHKVRDPYFVDMIWENLLSIGNRKHGILVEIYNFYSAKKFKLFQ